MLNMQYCTFWDFPCLSVSSLASVKDVLSYKAENPQDIELFSPKKDMASELFETPCLYSRLLHI